MNKTIVYSLVILLAVSCSSSKISVITPDTAQSYKEVVENKLGKEVLFIKNKPNTYVLCITETKVTVQQPRNKIRYVVVKIDNTSIVVEDSLENGSVNWSSKNELEIFRNPGIVRKDQSRNDFITLYNVESGKSYPKKNTEQH